MASGRVDAGPSILKTLQSLNLGEGFPPLTHPAALAQPLGGSPRKSVCLLLLLQIPANIQYVLFLFSPRITYIINFCYMSLLKNPFFILQ